MPARANRLENEKGKSQAGMYARKRERMRAI